MISAGHFWLIHGGFYPSSAAQIESKAFRATLEESSQADLLLHIIDCADQTVPTHIEQGMSRCLTRIDAIELPHPLRFTTD